MGFNHVEGFIPEEFEGFLDSIPDKELYDYMDFLQKCLSDKKVEIENHRAEGQKKILACLNEAFELARHYGVEVLVGANASSFDGITNKVFLSVNRAEIDKDNDIVIWEVNEE